MPKKFLVCMAVVLGLSGLTARADDFKPWAQTPPMGWNSWDCYASAVTEAQVLANAAFMRDYLLEYGWEYVIIDIRWYTDDTGRWYNQTNPLYTYDEYGRYLPDTGRFPSALSGGTNIGLKGIGDQLHAMGLKWGIHIMRGVPRVAVDHRLPIKGTSYTCDQIYKTDTLCTWLNDNYSIDCTKPGAQEYYNSLLDLYAEWGVDFLKVDDLSRPYHDGEIAMIRKAIDQCGRPIVFSMSPGATPLSKAADCQDKANMWRMMDDFWDSWSDLQKEFELCANWNEYRRDGNYPDCDMLPLGRLELSNSSYGGNGRWTNFTHDEQRTMMSLWTIFKSPLFFSGDLTYNDDWTTALITNKDAIYIDQHSTNNRLVKSDAATAFWAADDPASLTRYAALFNLTGSGTWIRFNEALYTTETISLLTDGFGQDVEVDIPAGVRQIALVVDDAGNGNSYDHGDWISPRVVLANGSERSLTQSDVVRTYTASWFNRVEWNRNVEQNGNMKVNGTTYSVGFATDANAMVLFNLPEGAVRFKGFCGIDDTGRLQSGSTSSIKFMVFPGDPTSRSVCNPSKAIASSGIVSFSSQASGVNLEADITAATELYLVMGDAGDGKDYDHGDWINPRIVDAAGNETLLTTLSETVLTATWGYRKNQELDGNPLKIAGTTYINGIGTNSDCIIKYVLPAGTEWKTFKSFCGIDDAVQGRNGASVDFFVFTSDPASYSIDIPLSLTDLGFAADEECIVTDIWTGDILGSFKNDNYRPSIPAHGCGYYKIVPGSITVASPEDCTNLISNASFEMGNMTGWNVSDNNPGETGVFTAAAKNFSNADGTYIYQSWGWWHSTFDVYHDPVTLSPGKYTLTARLASFVGRNLQLQVLVGDSVIASNSLTTTTDRTGVDVSVTFTLDSETAVVFKALSNFNGENFIMADHFRLERLGGDEVIYTLSEDEKGLPLSLDNVKLRLERTFYEGWNTVVLPFDVPDLSIFEDAAVEAAELKSVEGSDGAYTLTFQTVSSMEANRPYLFYMSANRDKTESLLFENCTVTPDRQPMTEGAAFDFVGSYISYAKNAPDNPVVAGDYFLGSGNTFKRASGGNALKAFRAYMRLKSSDVKANELQFFIDDVATTIDQIDGHPVAGSQALPVYNLSGQKVSKPGRGLYIVGGQKVLFNN